MAYFKRRKKLAHKTISLNDEATAARSLSSDDELAVACEFIVRRCWFHAEGSSLRADDAAAPGEGNPGSGFYVTFYLFGYGDNEGQVRARWAEGLCRVTSQLIASAP